MVSAKFNIICGIFGISYLNNFLKTHKILLKNINGTKQENELKLWVFQSFRKLTKINVRQCNIPTATTVISR